MQPPTAGDPVGQLTERGRVMEVRNAPSLLTVGIKEKNREAGQLRKRIR